MSDYRPTDEQLAYLRAFSPNSYAMDMPRRLAREMEERGWVEWVPPVLGTCWAITEAGRAIARATATPEREG